MYDIGVCVSELCGLDINYLRDDRAKLFLPSEIQKDYPTDASPAPATLSLASGTTRTLSAYLGSR